MSELTLLILRIAFLLGMWLFVFGVVYSLRADLFGVRVRKLPPGDGAQATTPRPTARPAPTPAVAAQPAPPKPDPKAVAAETAATDTGGSNAATTATATRIVITSGPKAGLELPLGDEPLTIGRSSESGLVIRDDYTSSHHARLVLWGDQWMLQDLSSTNGTWHNNERVASPVAIQLGAPIKVGATTFELRK